MNRTSLKLDAAISSWLEAQRILGRSPNSLYTYNCALTNLRNHLRKRRLRGFETITAADLLAWQHQLRTSGCMIATLGNFTLVVRRWFAWLVSTGRLFQNPARKLLTPAFRAPSTRCPSVAQVQLLLRAIDGRDRYDLRDRGSRHKRASENWRSDACNRYQYFRRNS